MVNHRNIIITVVTAVIILLLLLYYKRYRMPKNYTKEDAAEGLKAVLAKYGPGMASTVEKMYRLETAHFTSEQYRLTGTPGMEAGKWGKVRYGFAIATYATVQMKDNHVKDMRSFIVFPSVADAMLFLSAYISNYDGNFARWNTTDAAGQAAYRAKVEGMNSSIVNGLNNLA